MTQQLIVPKSRTKLPSILEAPGSSSKLTRPNPSQFESGRFGTILNDSQLFLFRGNVKDVWAKIVASKFNRLVAICLAMLSRLMTLSASNIILGSNLEGKGSRIINIIVVVDDVVVVVVLTLVCVCVYLMHISWPKRKLDEFARHHHVWQRRHDFEYFRVRAVYEGQTCSSTSHRSSRILLEVARWWSEISSLLCLACLSAQVE